MNEQGASVMKIYPSLISCDVLNLASTLAALDSHVDGYHIDIMDDHFVPNLTWGPTLVNALAGATTKPLQMHLMVENPASWVTRLNLQKKDSFVFHREVVRYVQDGVKLIEELKKRDIKAGLALNPKTGVEQLEPFVSLLDEILIMSVNPGFSGQKFIESACDKVPALVAMRQQKNLKFNICMDGGIGASNICSLQQAGVQIVSVASAIFSSSNYCQALMNLYALLGKS